MIRGGVIRALRLALIHMAAKHAGIEEFFSASTAVAVARPEPPAVNGAKPGKPAPKATRKPPQRRAVRSPRESFAEDLKSEEEDWEPDPYLRP